MIVTLSAAAYCVAMALASRLVPMCPCCGEEVRISRFIAAFVWAGLAGALVLLRRKRRQVLLGIALLSGVQVANFWEQFRHDEMSPTSTATWTLSCAALGVVVFTAMALFSKSPAAAK